MLRNCKYNDTEKGKMGIESLIIFALATMWRPPIAIAAICCIYGFEQWAQAQSGFFGQYLAFSKTANLWVTQILLKIVGD